MKLGMRRTAFTLALMLLVAGAAFGAAKADSSTTVNTAQELMDALGGGYTSIVLESNIITDSDVIIPSGVTIYINGKVWNIGDKTVDGLGTVDTSTPGSAVLRERMGSIPSADADKVYVACTIRLSGAVDGEIITSVTAGGGNVKLFDQRSVLSGSVTVYVPQNALGAMDNITAVSTNAGNYVLSDGSLERYYHIIYMDVVDASASGTAPSQASNAASINPVGFTVGTAEITLSDPTLDGYKFLGWTWDGRSEALAGAVKVSCANRSGLTLTAHWELAVQGGVWQGVGKGFEFAAMAPENAGDGEADVEQPTEEVPNVPQTQSPRVSRGSSSIKVVFSDDGASQVGTPTLDIPKTTRFPWAFVAALAAAGVVALGIFFGIRFRKSRR